VGVIALIDADSIVYRCGFAGQKTVEVPMADGDVAQFIEAEPVENVLHSVRLNLEKILQHADKALVFLTGKGNYRDAIATIRPYKGNRDKLKRPVHYDAVRAYLVDVWQALVVEGEEADDKISILARSPQHESSLIASIDKDLDQIPGKHYDFLKDVLYDVREDEAEYVFYRQCLSGDAVDNVPGCYKIGQAKAEKLLDATPRKEWWPMILETYEHSKEREDCPYRDKDAKAVAVETARLVRLRTYEGEIWSPPDE
jgi:DNA polymerase-1